MKIIDLLNKIANGEEVPEKIIWGCHEFEYNDVRNDFIVKDELENLSFLEFVVTKYAVLNDTVEILEEQKKIPEKLDYVHPDISCSYNESELLLRIEANKDKINEIINYLDYLKSKGE